MTGLDSQGRVPSMKDFLPKVWNTLNREDRLLRLQFAEDMAAQREGRYPRDVVAEAMDGILGQFRPTDPDKIFIHESFLDPGADAEKYNPYEALMTVYHEGRHAYQYGCAFLNEKNEEDALTVQAWKKNFTVYYDHNGYMGRMYYQFQPLEDDAETFALHRLKSQEPVFGGDSGYRDFIQKYKEDNGYNETIALLELGFDFRQTILDRINTTYDNQFSAQAQDNIAFQPEEIAPKKEPEATKCRFSPLHLAMTGVTVLLLVIMYFLSHPGGFLRTALWIISASLAFVPTVLLLRKKIFPKFFVSKVGGIVLTVLSWGVLVLLPLIYKLMFMVYVIGGILFLLYLFNVFTPNMLFIKKHNADGTVETETRVLGEDTADAEIAAAKSELRNQGYTIDE